MVTDAPPSQRLAFDHGLFSSYSPQIPQSLFCFCKHDLKYWFILPGSTVVLFIWHEILRPESSDVAVQRLEYGVSFPILLHFSIHLTVPSAHLTTSRSSAFSLPDSGIHSHRISTAKTENSPVRDSKLSIITLSCMFLYNFYLLFFFHICTLTLRALTGNTQLVHKMHFHYYYHHYLLSWHQAVVCIIHTH